MYSEKKKNGNLSPELETAAHQSGTMVDEKPLPVRASGKKLTFAVSKGRRQNYMTKSKKRGQR
jgi:hypothetical protein